MDRYTISSDSVIEPPRELSILDTADVLVAGGGVSGLGAAIASGREGARTILVEHLGFLGGVATANLMQNINAGRYMDGIILELVNRMADLGGATRWDTEKRVSAGRDGTLNESTTFDVECFKEVALQMCAEAGVILYLYTKASMPIVVDGAIQGIVVESKAGRQAIMASNVVDCTGDGDLLYRAGVPHVYGRETDKKNRPFGLMFHVGGLDIKRIHQYLIDNPDQWESKHRVDSAQMIGDNAIFARFSGFYDLVEQAKVNGDLYDEIHYLRMEALFPERGLALCNTTRIYYLDGTNPADLTRGEILAREQIGKIIAFMRKYVPGCEGAFLLDVAPTIGVRETRRFIGEYFLTDEDVFNDISFDDNIMYVERKMPPPALIGTVDVHPVDPIEGSRKDELTRDHNTPTVALRRFHYCYRMLLASTVDNLLFAGRTMSTTHATEAFTRSMPWCMRLGQVAGTAAALAAKQKVSPKLLSYDLLKDALIRQGYTKL